MSSLEKGLFRSLAHFSIGSFIFLELSCRSCLYIFGLILCLFLHLLLFSSIQKKKKNYVKGSHEKIRIWKSLPTMKITWSQNHPWKSLKLLTMFCVYNCMHTTCYNNVKPWGNGSLPNSGKLFTCPVTSLFLPVTTLLNLFFFLADYIGLTP